MIKKIKNIILALILPLTFAAPIALPAVTAFAACSTIGDNVAAGTDSGTNGNFSDNCGSDNTLDPQGGGIAKISKQAVTLFSYIVGVVSVIMIIYGGFRYITSGGDSGNVGNAKNTIIYALVGLIIVALAQALVHFVLNTTGSAVTGT